MSSFGNSVYVGDKKDGKPHGRGKMTYPDGSVYEGRCKYKIQLTVLVISIIPGNN